MTEDSMKYRRLTDNEKADITNIQQKGKEFLETLKTVESHYSASSTDLDTAKENVIKAIDLAVKHVTC